MRQLWILALLAAIFAAAASPALAQADAQAAFQQAKTAYQAGKFAEARDQARKAAETDAKNPEVLLLLGKAHYQLGELDEALAAWKQTLALAPQEPFAAKMLEVLQARRTDVDTRIKLVEALIAEKLFTPAGEECRSLLSNKALSDGQRARVMTLQVELAMRAEQPAEALKILRELLVLYPKQADPVQTTLLLGQAKLHSGGEATAEGLALLKKVVAEHADTPAATTARYELAVFDLEQTPDIGQIAVLTKWLAENPKHTLAGEGRRKLVTGYLAIARRIPKPKPDAVLDPLDAQALGVADQMIKQSVRSDEAKAVVDLVLSRLASHYAANRAYAAAIAGAERLLAARLPLVARVPVLKALAGYKAEIAVEYLENQARSGSLATADGAALPKPLADAVAAYNTVNQEDPADPAWDNLANLAARTRSFSARVIWPDSPMGMRPTDAWAVAIAIPVIKANADVAAVKGAVEQCQSVIRDYAELDRAAVRRRAVVVGWELIGALSPRHPSWSATVTAQATLLDNFAKFVFARNVKAGRAADNAKLSTAQTDFLDALQVLIVRDVAQTPAALRLLAEHLKPWIEHGHWAVAEEAYATMVTFLSPPYSRDVDLAVINLWIDQVTARDRRLVAAGMTVPRELDPAMKKALLRSYELQAGLDPESPKLQQVRAVWTGVLAHYKNLDYDDVVQAAIEVKPEKPVEAADQYAAFQLIRLHEDQAHKELGKLLKQYGAADKIALTPGLKAVIGEWTKFITDQPGSTLARSAVEQVFGIAGLFDERGAYDVSAAIYGDFAKFAAGVKVLSQSSPGSSSTAERAAYSAAGALDRQARKLLAKASAERKPGDPPPAKLSDEFAAAIAAYKAIVEANPEGPLAADCLRKVMTVAVEYAGIDAWDVAEAVYADLQKSKLKIRRPERLEFARGMCQLGRAMPAHAREILSALAAAGLGGWEGRETTTTDLAAASGPAPPGDWGGDRTRGRPNAPATEPARPAESPPPPLTRSGAGNLTLGGINSYSGGTTITGAGTPQLQPTPEAKRDSELLAMIQRQESNRAARLAQMDKDESADSRQLQMPRQQSAAQQGQGDQQNFRRVPPAPVLSEAELARLDKAFSAAYEIFQGIRKNYADTPTAAQARAEVFVMIGHWRSLTQWQRSAALAMKFLGDNPADPQLPALRLEVARDRLAWAAKPLEKQLTRQEMLAEVSSRFKAARSELTKIIAEFAKERPVQQEAQWDLANSFLTEARALSAVSPTLARGQFVRAARELRAVAAKYANHPRISSIPQMLWSIAQELEARQYEEEAITVWNELAIYDPTGPLTQQAMLKTAQTYQRGLKRPLKAAETYLELNFIRGGSDPAMQDAIFQIGTLLKSEKRWIEALHVLKTFVDSFPRHAQAGQALTMVGQIHQTNEAWKDAIAAYRRVIAEYGEGQWVHDAKWAIAECTINLSQWKEATAAYRDYVANYPQDPKLPEANRRIEVLKDLARYQGLVDEKGQRKAFDAQFQIAQIVRTQLANPVKAIIEYRKVADNWPESYVAADALYQIGLAYMGLHETEKAREALQVVAKKYPTSPLAGAALFMVGKSYEDEANKLATVTREKAVEEARDRAQRKAYEAGQSLQSRNFDVLNERVSSLKKAGKGKASIELQEAANAYNGNSVVSSGTLVFAQQAAQDVEALTATQLADRQDKINAALRKAIDAYDLASKVPGGSKADLALLQMANIYDQRLKDSQAAMRTWQEIVRQFSGTAVAEEASWKLAQYYDREGKYDEAVDAYNSFLRNYRRSPNAGAAQFAVAECYERQGKWVAAMDSYNNYINNFADGPLVGKAKEQINWIKTYRL